ncbi:hypothetical protein LguiB_013447 [Lonicera macranthoides]
MGDSSASASTSTSAVDPPLFGVYEVFLNFCGQDTRYGFTDYLFTSLTRAGIRTFRDDNNIPHGEEFGSELFKAINDSKIFIPIFSKNYASRKWCLIELTYMVQCMKNRGQKILPIFYDVTPDDVKHQCGSYEKAFRQHEEAFRQCRKRKRKCRHNKKVIQEWKNALKEVGKLEGLELPKKTCGYEGQLVAIITKSVSEILMQNNKHEDFYLVGMPSRIEKIEKLLNIHSDGVRFIGVHGMGGLGKTTIADVIYNKYQHHFDCHSFLPDVQQTETRNGIVHLQKQLLSAILKSNNVYVNDYKDGIRQIKGIVGRKKVLIVLDDVNNESQIEKLVGSWTWFGARSRIIITTRNYEVLHAFKSTIKGGHPEVYGSYQLDYLNPVESLELFCKHAFGCEKPPEDYDTLSKGIASTAAGLPLVLKVTGSSLCGVSDKELWKSKMEKLKEVPDEGVQKKLRLSFDPLTDEQKHIFLDIACLFIGHNKINPCYMWDDFKFHPRIVLNDLVCRSLITVGDDDILRMHDQLRDLGRQIVREEKLDELGRRSRLWNTDEAFEVYETGQGTEKVEALCLKSYPLKLFDLIVDDSEHANPRHLEGEKFCRLPNLRYLTLDALGLYGDFKHCLPNLRWLQWRYCMLEFTPTNLHLRNLVILDLSFSDITEQSHLWSQIQMSKKLKVLNLFECNRLRGVHFLSTFSNLERLSVSNCEVLCSLDGIEELESLRHLDAACCDSLETLPNLSRLTKLKELKVEGYTLITNIPGLDKLESLELLCLRYCVYLQRLPDLSNLKSLKELDVSGTMLTEIRGLGGLKSLEVLDMSHCACIKRVFGLINLKRLKRLNILCCVQLIEIHGLERLESLEFLEMTGCNFIEIPDLSKLKSLKALSANGCGKLTKIGGLEELISLEYLEIGYCKLIENLPDFSNLRKLRVIVATGCEILTAIRGLENLESFGDLFIYGCESLNTLIYSHVSRIRIHTNYNYEYYGISELYISFNVFHIQVIYSMIAI